MKNGKNITAPTIRALVSGVDKAGKTQFATTFPNPIILELDRGEMTLKGQDVDYEDFVDVEATKVYETVNKFLDDVAREEKYKTIVVDTFNRLDYYLNLHLRPTGPMQIADWGFKLQKNTEFMIKLMSIQARYQKNILVLVHEKIEKDEFTGKVSVLPALQGAIQGTIGSFFDERYHIEKEVVGTKREFKLYIENQGLYTAGSKLMAWTGELKIPADYKEIMKRAKKS